MSGLDFAARGLVSKLDTSLASTAPGKGASQIGAAGGGTVQERLSGFATRSAIKRISPVSGDSLYLNEPGREGTFRWHSEDLSYQVANDSEEGIFIAPDSDPTGASGAWRRKFEGRIMAAWFGWHSSALGTANKVALQAAIDCAEASFVYSPQGCQIVDLGTGIFGLGGTGDMFGVERIHCHIEGHGHFATQIIWLGEKDATVIGWDSNRRGHCTGIRFRNYDAMYRPKHWIDIDHDSGHGKPRLTDWGDSFSNFYESVSDHPDAAALNFGAVVNYDDRGLRFQGGTRNIRIRQPATASNRRVFRLADYTYDYSPSGAGEFSEHILVDVTGAGSIILELAPTRCEGSAAMAGPNPAFVRVTDTQGPDNIGAEAVTLIYHGAGIDHSGATGCWLVYQDTAQTGPGAPHTNIYLPNGIYLVNFQGLQGGNWNATHKGLEPTFATATTLPPYSSGRVASGMFPYLGRNPRFKGTIEGDSGVQFLVGTGNPEGSKSAAKGSLFLRTDGAAGYTFYVKTGGTQASPTATGWYNASIQRSGSTIASPSADLASLKTAVDAIRAALSSSGVTN